MDVGFTHNYSKQNQRFFDVIEELRGLLMPIKGYENQPLVSLEESVSPLVPLLPNIHTYVFMAKDNSPIPPPDDLSLDESASICLYSMEWEPNDHCLSRVLNRTLRSKDRQKLIPWYLYLKLLLTALTHLPTNNNNNTNKIIYRGIKSDLSKDYPQGKIFIWWGFSSCTQTLSILESMPFIGKIGIRTIFIIHSYSAKNITKYTFFQNEEVLLLPATRFIVLSVEHQSTNLHLIHIKEIPPPFTLLEPINISNSSFLIKLNQLSVTNSLPTTNKIPEKKRLSIDQNSLYSNSKLEQLISKNEFSSSMDFSQEQLTDQDIPILIEQALITKQCTILDLTANEITFEGGILLANALNNNKTLKELILYNNHLDDKGVRALASELSMNNNTLKKLNLGLNDLTDDGAQHIAQMLKTNQSLTHLWLQQNQIGDRGIKSLADVLARQNWSMEFLDLSSNQSLTDASIPSLIDMLKLNQSIQILDINQCSLNETNEVKLKEIIKSKKDFQLFI